MASPMTSAKSTLTETLDAAPAPARRDGGAAMGGRRAPLPRQGRAFRMAPLRHSGGFTARTGGEPR